MFQSCERLRAFVEIVRILVQLGGRGGRVNFTESQDGLCWEGKEGMEKRRTLALDHSLFSILLVQCYNLGQSVLLQCGHTQ